MSGPQAVAVSSPRPALPARVRWYVAATTAAALVALPLSLIAPGVSQGIVAELEAVALAAVIALAHRRLVHIGPKRKVSIATAPEVAAVLLLPGPLAVFAIAVGAVVGEAPVRVRPIQRVFNAAVAVLRAVTGAALYALTVHLPPLTPIEPAAAIVAAGGMYIVTTAIVRGIAAVQLGRPPPLRGWLPSSDLLIIEASLALIGVLAAVAASAQPWALLLIVAPAILALQPMKLTAALEQELTRREQAEAVIRDNEERFRTLVQRSSDLITLLNDAGSIQYISPSVERILGYPPETLLGTPLVRLVHPEDVASLDQALAGARGRDGGQRLLELRQRTATGPWRSFEVTLTNLLDQASVNGILLNAHDITGRKQLEGQLTQQAFTDPLTGLPNRALFMNRLANALATAIRKRTTVAVYYLDLDNFKQINDAVGHRGGDEALAAVAGALSASIRPSDTVARFGGDEFTILIEDASDAGTLMAVAQRLLTAVNRPLRVLGQELTPSVSVGIAVTDGAAGPVWPDTLLQQADLALYRAKAEGKGRAAIFEEGLTSPDTDRLRLRSDLYRAWERDELVLHYQPEVEIDSLRTVGVEALVRWNHPRRGLLPPSAFIPLAEETGMIVPLGQWVVQQACRQARAWQGTSATDPPLQVSINLSPHQLRRREFVSDIEESLRRYDLTPAAIRLEVTESALLDDVPTVARTIDDLHAIGVGLALDDFGTGFSALSYLWRFQVDTLKLDRSFVSALDDGTRGTAVIRAIAALGEELGMEVTAEGIETEEQCRRVRALGCRRGQGFYFGRPVPAAGITSLLHGNPPASKPK